MHFNDDASRTKVLEKVVRYIWIFVEFINTGFRYLSPR